MFVGTAEMEWIVNVMRGCMGLERFIDYDYMKNLHQTDFKTNHANILNSLRLGIFIKGMCPLLEAHKCIFIFMMLPNHI